MYVRTHKRANSCKNGARARAHTHTHSLSLSIYPSLSVCRSLSLLTLSAKLGNLSAFSHRQRHTHARGKEFTQNYKRMHAHKSKQAEYRVQTPLRTCLAELRRLQVKGVPAVPGIEPRRAHMQRNPQDQVVLLSRLWLPVLFQVCLEICDGALLDGAVLDGLGHVRDRHLLLVLASARMSWRSNPRLGVYVDAVVLMNMHACLVHATWSYWGNKYNARQRLSMVFITICLCMHIVRELLLHPT
jgi:hypothetical protein